MAGHLSDETWLPDRRQVLVGRGRIVSGPAGDLDPSTWTAPSLRLRETAIAFVSPKTIPHKKCCPRKGIGNVVGEFSRRQCLHCDILRYLFFLSFFFQPHSHRLVEFCQPNLDLRRCPSSSSPKKKKKKAGRGSHPNARRWKAS